MNREEKEEKSVLLDKGKELFISGRPQDAIGIYRQILDKDPEFAPALLEEGKAWHVLGDHGKARSLLEKASSGGPPQAEVSILLAKTYRALGFFRKAQDILIRLKEKDPDDPEIDRELDWIYQDEYTGLPSVSEFIGKYGETVREYEKRAGENPENRKVLAHLAQLYNFGGQYAKTKLLVTREKLDTFSEERFFRNKLLNELEIAEGKTVLESKVRSLAVTLSNRCNLDCIMCLTSKVNWDLPEPVIGEIVDLFPCLERIMWQGGEVFALPYFTELLKKAFRHPNLKQRIVTNGLLITPELAGLLVKNNVELTFSVDGVTKEVYEKIRRGGDFEKLKGVLRRISEIRKQNESRMVLNLNVAVMKSNYRQLEGFLDFAKEYGFNFVCLMPIHIHLKTPEDIFTNRDEEALDFIRKLAPRLEKTARSYGIRLENRLPHSSQVSGNETGGKKKKGIEKPGQFLKKFLCHIPWQQLTIDYDGTVRPDCLCFPEKSAGDLKKTPSLSGIWNNEVMQEYRKRIIEGSINDFCSPFCLSGLIEESHLKIP